MNIPPINNMDPKKPIQAVKKNLYKCPVYPEFEKPFVEDYRKLARAAHAAWSRHFGRMLGEVGAEPSKTKTSGFSVFSTNETRAEANKNLRNKN